MLVYFLNLFFSFVQNLKFLKTCVENKFQSNCSSSIQKKNICSLFCNKTKWKNGMKIGVGALATTAGSINENELTVFA